GPSYRGALFDGDVGRAEGKVLDGYAVGRDWLGARILRTVRVHALHGVFAFVSATEQPDATADHYYQCYRYDHNRFLVHYDLQLQSMYVVYSQKEGRGIKNRPKRGDLWG